MKVVIVIMAVILFSFDVNAENLRVTTHRSENPFLGVLVFTQNDTLIKVPNTIVTRQHKDKYSKLVKIEFLTVDNRVESLLYTYYENSANFATVTAISQNDTVFVRHFSKSSSPTSKIEYKNNKPYKKHIYDNVTWQIKDSFLIGK